MKTKKVSQSLRHIVAKSGKNGEQTWLPFYGCMQRIQQV